MTETASPNTPTPPTTEGSALTPLTDAPAAPAPTSEGVAVEPPVALTAEDLTLPEGMTLTDEARTEFFGILEGTGSAKEKANSLLALAHKSAGDAVQATVDEYARQWTQTEEAWKQAIQEQFPGDKLAAAQSNIAKLLDKYGDSDARAAFTATGAGNNPHIFALLNKIAADLTELPPVQGNPTNGAQLTRADRLYGVKNNG